MPLVMIVGMCGAGKSIVTGYFRREGWQVVRFGEITIDELRLRCLEPSEANERLIREELRTLHGPDAYAKMLLPKITHALTVGPTVIDGLYSWAEYKFLRENIDSQMYLIAVFTPRALRYERLSRRGMRALVPEEAEQRDFAEIENLQKGGPIAMADYVILNDGSKEDLVLEIKKLLLSDIFKARPVEKKGE